jgi:hypothetical protein
MNNNLTFGDVLWVLGAAAILLFALVVVLGVLIS